MSKKVVRGDNLISSVRKIKKIGGGYAIFIPKEWLEKVGLKEEDELGFVGNNIAKLIPMKEHK